MMMAYQWSHSSIKNVLVVYSDSLYLFPSVPVEQPFDSLLVRGEVEGIPLSQSDRQILDSIHAYAKETESTQGACGIDGDLTIVQVASKRYVCNCCLESQSGLFYWIHRFMSRHNMMELNRSPRYGLRQKLMWPRGHYYGGLHVTAPVGYGVLFGLGYQPWNLGFDLVLDGSLGTFLTVSYLPDGSGLLRYFQPGAGVNFVDDDVAGHVSARGVFGFFPGGTQLYLGGVCMIPVSPSFDSWNGIWRFGLEKAFPINRNK